MMKSCSGMLISNFHKSVMDSSGKGFSGNTSPSLIDVRELNETLPCKQTPLWAGISHTRGEATKASSKAARGLETAGGEGLFRGFANRPFPSCLLPLSLLPQNKSKCKTFHTKMSLICI